MLPLTPVGSCQHSAPQPGRYELPRHSCGALADLCDEIGLRGTVGDWQHHVGLSNLSGWLKRPKG